MSESVRNGTTYERRPMKPKPPISLPTVPLFAFCGARSALSFPGLGSAGPTMSYEFLDRQHCCHGMAKTTKAARAFATIPFTCRPTTTHTLCGWPTRLRHPQPSPASRDRPTSSTAGRPTMSGTWSPPLQRRTPRPSCQKGLTFRLGRMIRGKPGREACAGPAAPGYRRR